MIETFSAVVEKVTETAADKTTTFFGKLEKSIKISKPKLIKEAENISEFWKNLENNEDTTNNKKSENFNDFSQKDTTNTSEQVEKLKKAYIENLKQNSEYPETIQDDGKLYEKLSPEETAEKRAEFNANKEKLIKEWETINDKEWPKYKEDIYLNGKLMRKAGDRYDAHHVHPLSLGGRNEARNLTPISAEKHFDKQGVHAPESPYGKIEKAIQGGKTV